ncbi:hypothetical protein Bca4012_029682 [Brassica carinata]|uniref:Uncharacterized protein n=1 Tax=Brassica carinata TaxID=52824 RepID=A0A8X7UUQ6_BRACI|nr:hypothetical protein Bca52824_048870 [Brassica carinata]
MYTQIYTSAQPPVPPPASPLTPPDSSPEAVTRFVSGATGGVMDEATLHASSAVTLLLLPHRSFLSSIFKPAQLTSHRFCYLILYQSPLPPPPSFTKINKLRFNAQKREGERDATGDGGEERDGGGGEERDGRC